MQAKSLTKLMLDIVLTALFIILIFPRETGFTFHEIAGLSIGVLFIYHIMLNWPWVKNVGKNLFNLRMKSKPKLFYLLNSLSLIAVSTIIITGVQISEVLFPAQGMVSHTLLVVHKWISYGCLGLFGLHLALHWKFFVHTVPRMFRSPGRPAWGKVVLKLGAMILTLGMLYSQLAVSSTNNTRQSIARREPQDASYAYYDKRSRPSQDLPPAGLALTGPNPGESNQDAGISSGPYVSSTHSSPSNDSGKTDAVNNGSQNPRTDTMISDDSASTGSGSAETIAEPTDSGPTLADYLSSLFCTGCEKHCSLLSPRCDRGILQQEAARQEYQAIYSSNVTI